MAPSSSGPGHSVVNARTPFRLRLELPRYHSVPCVRYRIVPDCSHFMKFYYVYVLHNSKKNFIYIGYSENPKRRYQEHNLGKVRSTKPYKPLRLIFYEAYSIKSDAKRRELYLKSNKGRTTLVTMLRDYFSNIADNKSQA